MYYNSSTARVIFTDWKTVRKLRTSFEDFSRYFFRYRKCTRHIRRRKCQRVIFQITSTFQVVVSFMSSKVGRNLRFCGSLLDLLIDWKYNEFREIAKLPSPSIFPKFIRTVMGQESGLLLLCLNKAFKIRVHFLEMLW